MKKFLKLRNIIIVLILALIAFGYFHNKQVKAEAAAKFPTKYNSKTQTIVTSKKQDIESGITLSGSIDAEEKAQLAFQTSGQLSWIGVKPGDQVKKWQAVAQLDQRILKKQLEQDLNNYLTTKSTFDDTQAQYKNIKEKYLLTDDMKRILDRTQNTLNNSVSNYEIGELTLKYATLISPIKGVVTDVQQPVSGVNINPGNASISIINPESIYLRSKIDQEDVNKIKVGDKAILKIDSFSDEKIDSEITYIAFTPVAGEASTVYQVKFKLPVNGKNQDLKYRLGMDGDATIVLSQAKNVITAPIEAIIEDEGKKFVLVKTTDNKIIKKEITTGIENDTDIEIKQGLTDNEQLIIKK